MEITDQENHWCNKLYREVKLGVFYVLDTNFGNRTLKIKKDPLTCVNKLLAPVFPNKFCVWVQ